MDLSDDDRAVLVDAVSRWQPSARSILEELLAGRCLNAYEGDLLRGAIGEELAASGVADGAINDRGRLLDDLIDWVGARTDWEALS